jgi:hypothetical protein
MNSNQLDICKIKNEEILEATNTYKIRAKLPTPNKSTQNF